MYINSKMSRLDKKSTQLIQPIHFNRYDPKSDYSLLKVDPTNLLLYAENVSQYFDILNGIKHPPSGGTAVVRGCSNSCPIVTVDKGKGIKTLDQTINHKNKSRNTILCTVKNLIEWNFENMYKKLEKNPRTYKKVLYSSVLKNGREIWGNSIFDVGDEVLLYITQKIDEINSKDHSDLELLPSTITDPREMYGPETVMKFF